MAAPISSQNVIAVPSENVGKSGFLTFSVRVEMELRNELS